MKQLKYQSAPILIWDKFISDRKAILTTVITVFNQQNIIANVLNALARSIQLQSHLIIIEDGSEDDTLSALINAINNIEWNIYPFSSIAVYKNSHSRFETACDDFGIKLASTDYVVLLQSDVLITEHGFDRILFSSLTSFEDLLMVSGRGAEPILPQAIAFKQSTGSIINGKTFRFASRLSANINLSQQVRSVLSAFLAAVSVLELKLYLIFKHRITGFGSTTTDQSIETRPNQHDFSYSGSAGYLRSHNQTEKSNFKEFGTIWVSQTIMRGPICIDRRKYLNCGGFNTNSCFLGFDDHELTLRSYLMHQYRVGFVPIGYRSEPNWGTTRKPRSYLQTKLAIYETMRVSKHREKTALYKINDLLSTSLPLPEIRNF